MGGGPLERIDRFVTNGVEFILLEAPNRYFGSAEKRRRALKIAGTLVGLALLGAGVAYSAYWGPQLIESTVLSWILIPVAWAGGAATFPFLFSLAIACWIIGGAVLLLAFFLVVKGVKFFVLIFSS